MFFIVGLGNAGQKYEGTRHNVGFEVVDRLASRAGLSVFDKKFKALVGRGRLEGRDCFFMKPQTFMNLSGESVGPAVGFFKGSVEDVVVIHDDIDLDLGRLKLKQGGGHGGHNGLRSLLRHLPSDRFIRVRMGVGRPPPQWDPADYVLSRFSSTEQADVEACLDDATRAVETILSDGLSRAMERYNRSAKNEGDSSETSRRKGRAAEADRDE